MLAAAEGIWHLVKRASLLLKSFALTLGGPGLFLIALGDSSFLSVPEGNDLLIIVLSTGASWERMTYYVVMTILGSVTGCTLLYSVGRRGGGFFVRRFKKKSLDEVAELYRRRGLWAIIIPSILPPPTPFKVFVLSAGIFRIPFQKFLLAVLVGRSIRYFFWGVMAMLFGERAGDFLQHNMATVGLILFILFIASIVGYVWLWSRSRKKAASEGAA